MAGFDSHVQDTWRAVLLDQVRMLQAAKVPQQFADVHADLLERFAARQSVATERPPKSAELNAELQRLIALDPKPVDNLRRVNQTLAILKAQEERDAILQHVARCIADGLIWRLLAADRCAVTVFGNGQRVGRLPDGPGFDAEHARIRKHAAAGRLAIHNDLTNCMREADLTVFGPGWPPSTVTLDEVKLAEPGRSRNDRVARQSDRLDRKLKILRDGYDPDAGGGVGAHLLRLPVAYRTHLDALGPVLSRARRDGQVRDEVADGVLVSAIFHPAVEDHAALTLPTDDPAEVWGPLPNDRDVQGSSVLRRFEDRRSDHRVYQAIAPLSLFPLSAEDVVDVLLGWLDYTVTYRFDAIEAAFAARGIHAACAGADAWNERLLVASRGNDTVTVSPHVSQQLTQELMTVETLVDMVEALLDLVAGGLATDELHMLFCDERDAWPGLVI